MSNLTWKSTDSGIEVGELGRHGWEWWTSIPYADWPAVTSEYDLYDFITRYFMYRWPAEMVTA